MSSFCFPCFLFLFILLLALLNDNINGFTFHVSFLKTPFRKKSILKSSKVYYRLAAFNDLKPFSKILVNTFEGEDTQNSTALRVVKATGVMLDLESRFLQMKKLNQSYGLFLATIKSSNDCSNQPSIIGGIEVGNWTSQFLELDEQLPFLSNLAVLPNYRRKGIATNLVAVGETYAKTCFEQRWLYAAVDKQNQIALHFYQKLNYFSVNFKLQKKFSGIQILRKELNFHND
jgi:ribosomal protein S18 acetylase RimI-like enzyme